MTPIEQLLAAGFSEQEIGEWATSQRATMTEAGFADAEIDHFLTGPKEPVPPALFKRSTESQKTLDDMRSVGMTTVAGGLGMLVDFVMDPLAPIRTIIDPRLEHLEQSIRPHPGAAGADVAHKIAGVPEFKPQTAGERVGLATAQGAVAGGPFGMIGAGIGGLTGLAQQGTMELTDSERASAAVGLAVGAVGGALPLLGRRGNTLTRIEADPQGGTRETPIGGLPEPIDFAASAQAIMDSNVPNPAIVEKLRQLWREHGIHPSEAALDAARDPTIAQDLASTTTELPSRYAGDKQPRGMPPGPEPDAPSGPVTDLRPGELRVDPYRFQFKSGTDAGGVNERLLNIDTWDPVKAGLVTVFEDRDGVRWIADGHQRLGLAQRIEAFDPAQAPRLNAWVLREMDGYTDADMRAIAAAKNLTEGTGTPAEAAAALPGRPDLATALPLPSDTVRQSRGLTNLDGEAFSKVTSDAVPPNHAAIVGRLVPDDPKLQNELIDLLTQTAPETAAQAEAIVRQGRDAATRPERQGTLFDEADIATSLYRERAQILDNALTMLSRDRALSESLVENPKIVEDIGSRLASDENARQAAVDGHAAQNLQTLANRPGPLSDALTAAARELADGKSIAAVSGNFISALRRQAEGGAFTRGADGGRGGAVDATSPRGTGTPVPAERSPRVVSPEAEARAEAHIGETLGTYRIEAVERTATDSGFPGEPHRLINPQGEVWGRAYITKKGDGTAAIEWVEGPVDSNLGGNAEAANTLGPRAMRQVARSYFDQNPDVQSLSGERISGARRAARPWLADSSAGEVVTITREQVMGRPPAAAPGAGEPRPFFFPDPDAPSVGMMIGAPRRRLTPAEQTVLAHIDVGGRRSRAAWSWNSFYTNTVDRLNRIPDRNIAGQRLPTSDNPYQMMRLLAGNSARSQGWLELGQVDFATGNKIGPSLKEILAPVQGDLNPLRAFIDSVRAIELETQGIQTGFDQAAIRQVATAGMQEFGPIMGRLIEFQNNLTAYLRDAGVISAADHAKMLNDHIFYMPMHTVLDNPAAAGAGAGSSTIQPQNPLFRIQGSKRVKIDPLESIIQHTFQYVAMAERNKAATVLKDELVARGEAAPATSTTPPERQVRTFEQGQERLWEVDAGIADTVKNIDGDAVSFLVKWLNSDKAELRVPAQAVTLPARTLRAGTTLGLDFLLRNPITDYFQALAQSQKPLYTPWDTMMGGFDAVMKNENFRRWWQGGGGAAELVALDRRYLQENIRKLNEDTGIMTRAWNLVRHPLDLPRAISELSERATRLGEFRYVYKRELRNGATPDEASRTAGFASREVTIDFSRRGAVTQALNLIDAFWNAGVQGLDRTVRQIRDHPFSTGLKVVAGITLPSVLLWWHNHDDPRWQQIPDWQRDLFWIWLGDNWADMGPAEGQPDQKPYAFEGASWRVQNGRYERNDGAIRRLRKPFEFGIIFGSGIERLLDAYFTDLPDQLAPFVKSVGTMLSPVPGTTLATPIFEQFANRSLLTDRNLIPPYLEKELPEYQYQPYTTETAKALGKMITAFPGMRDTAMGSSQVAGVARALTTPILMENYVRAWTGASGMDLLRVADYGLRKAGIVPDPPKPAWELSDIPGVRAFTMRYPSANTASIQKFYDETARIERYFTSWRARYKEGDFEAMLRIEAAGGDLIFQKMDARKLALGAHAKAIRDIDKNPEMLPEERRQQIDTLYYNMIQVATYGLEDLRDAQKALAPAER
jgi:hypothetical protein